MARALLVGCGCRGRELGRALIAESWLVRGTSRDPARLEAIGAAGIEPAVADPDAAASILDLVGDVTIVCWLLGSAHGDAAAVAALHGPRLERLLEELVDTPVRGLVYEAAGSVASAVLAGGSDIVLEAERRWRIPARIVEQAPAPHPEWLAAMRAAVLELVA